MIGIVFTKPQKSTFERTTVFNRNYVESYAARKAHAKIIKAFGIGINKARGTGEDMGY
ncbi:hypothetical protein [Flagellimonas sp.]|uniref:hypothetical protein n=1 Tax=Flagellimonas sp. TaxID=2058762 RepID=UPI003BAA6448